MALFEGGACGKRVLELATRAAQLTKQPLEVLVPARSGAAGQRAVAEATSVLADARVATTVRRLPTSAHALHGALAAAHGQLLFLDAAGRSVAADRLPAVRSAAKCDVLLVSQP